MELWTLINKETKKPIRFTRIQTNDEEFGSMYFFSNKEYLPIWTTDSEEKAVKANQENLHLFYAMSAKTPYTEGINMEEYEVVKFVQYI